MYRGRPGGRSSGCLIGPGPPFRGRARLPPRAPLAARVNPSESKMGMDNTPDTIDSPRLRRHMEAWYGG